MSKPTRKALIRKRPRFMLATTRIVNAYKDAILLTGEVAVRLG